MSDSIDKDDLHERIIAALRQVYDPEIPVNLYDLGLIYDIDVRDAGAVHVTMTLTAPNCPVADKIPADVQQKVREVEGVSEATVELVWEPAWSTEKMTEVAELELEAMGIDPRRAKEAAGATQLTFGRKPTDRR